MSDSQFLFTVCQAGAEAALKSEIAREWPQFRLAFSRPGFVTFKVPGEFQRLERFDLRSTFARAFGHSLGRLQGEDAHQLAPQVWELMGDLRANQLHIWQRDTRLPGERGYVPGLSPLAEELGAVINEHRPGAADTAPLPINETAGSRDLILDCVLVEPNEWWIGVHKTGAIESRWPGGVYRIKSRSDAVSRAYYKTIEAIEWSRLPIAADDDCVDIGSAPGGASQALLELGAHVVGIDPAEMDPEILEHPRFLHIRKKAAEVRRKDFQGIRWLLADSNVAPAHTLDSVEAIVNYPEVRIRGMLLTLKLLEWELAEEIPRYLSRIRSWGFGYVRARQLASNRREFCVAAMRNRAMRRFRRQRSAVTSDDEPESPAAPENTVPS